MKLLIVSCLIAAVFADVSHVVGKDESYSKIVKQEFDSAPEGGYQWIVETENGIRANVKADIVKVDAEKSIQKVQGEASWTSPEGEPIVLQYTADENGFQPQGSHLPTPPPTPEAILRSLEYIRSHPPAPEKK